MWEQVQQTVSYIKEKTNFTPEYGVILGSGLGSFTDDIKIEFTLPYFQFQRLKATKALWFSEPSELKKLLPCKAGFTFMKVTI